MTCLMMLVSLTQIRQDALLLESVMKAYGKGAERYGLTMMIGRMGNQCNSMASFKSDITPHCQDLVFRLLARLLRYVYRLGSPGTKR